jgi:hypothetical protein
MRGLSCLDRKAWGSIFNHGHSRALIAPFIYLGCKNGWTSDVDAKHDLGQQLVKISFHFSGLVKSIMEYYRSLHYSKQMMDVQAGLSSHWNVPTRATHIVW